MATKQNDVAEAICRTLVSPNVPDRNMEPANLVDTTDRIGSAIYALADAVPRLAEQNERQADALHNLVDAHRWNGVNGVNRGEE